MGLEDYITAKEAGGKWGITPRRAQYLCEERRVSGAEKKGGVWLIPISAEKPVDGRYKNGRKPKSEKGSDDGYEREET
jgi:hypothetical protein